jgi:protease YdgD
MRTSLVLLSAVALAGTIANAQDIPAALGRISYAAEHVAGAAMCTGVLVAPDLVLTAGHCLRGAAGDPASVWFAAAYRDGQSSALVQGAEVILIDGAVGGDFARDLALLRLVQAIPSDQVTPLPLANPVATSFTLIAYRRDAPDQITRTDTCAPVPAPDGMLGLTCQVVSGNSGAPVLQQVDSGWQIAGIIVASANGRRLRALAAIPPPAFRALIAAGVAPR